MRVTVRGSGNSHGIPATGCDCPACEAARCGNGPRRTPVAALVEIAGAVVPIDAGAPGLAVTYPAPPAILLTHHHPDHVAGLRAERQLFAAGVALYGPADPPRDGWLRDDPGHLAWRPVEAFTPLTIGRLRATPVPLSHPVPTFGWLLDGNGVRVAWLTDTRGLPDATVAAVRTFAPRAVAIDCSFAPGDPRAAAKGHHALDEALASLARLQCPRSVLIHIDHSLQAWLDEEHQGLPPGVEVGTDGMVL